MNKEYSGNEQKNILHAQSRSRKLHESVGLSLEDETEINRVLSSFGLNSYAFLDVW